MSRASTLAGKPSWEPILEAGAAERAIRVVTAIAHDVANLEPAGMAHGRRADLACFFGYLSHALGDGRYHELSARWLDALVDGTDAVTLESGLFGGVAGVAWTLEHLRSLGATDSSEPEADDDPNVPIDDVLAGLVAAKPWHLPYDLIGGLVGHGVYFLERLHSPAARVGLARVVDQLDDLSRPARHGLTWLTRPELLPAWQREQAPQGYYNLGLAHGVPGVIVLLSWCLRQGISVEQCRRLLSGAIEWVFSHNRERPGARFVSWVPVGREAAEQRDSRLAWCYGDPGVAAALWAAGLALDDTQVQGKAVAVLDHCLVRPHASARLWDAGLCHGTAGLGHLYNRLGQSTGLESLRNAARHWLERTLAMHTPGAGHGGYRSYAPSQERDSPWEDDESFLTGSTGIGLALLAGFTDADPGWDRRLLLSAPPPRARAAYPERR